MNQVVFCLSLSIEFVVQELMSFIRSYVVPDGFPDSVTPSYVPYMKWRALKVLFIFMNNSSELEGLEKFFSPQILDCVKALMMMIILACG